MVPRKKTTDLVELYKKKMACLLTNPDLAETYTWNDFFDEAGIAKESRTDFAIAAILKQSLEGGE